MRHAMLSLLVAALVAGLATSPAAAEAPTSLVVQTVAEPPGLDLTATPASATAAVVFYNIQEALVKVDRHGKLVPWLAERWHTTDNRNYTFFLKRGVRFHNGRALQAADVKYVFERAMNPETKHPYPGYYAAIGAIIVKDDYTITFSLKSLNANFLLNLARQGSVIYPREAVDTLKTEPMGTGPFKLAEWVRGDRIVLTRNPDYHVQGLPRLDRVVFRFIPDPNATLAALKAGDVDASLFGLGPEHVQEAQQDPRFQVIVGDTTNDVILAMNNSRKPYADVRVRRAVTVAINKAEVLKGAMFGLGRILGSNVDPLNPYYVDVSGLMPYDPAKAKRLLAEAGYPNGFETVLRVAPQYYYTVRTGEVIANHLAKVGVKVRIEQIEWGQWISRVWREADYDLTIIGHAEAWDIANYANPKYYFRYDSPEFQKLFQQSEVTRDDRARGDGAEPPDRRPVRRLALECAPRRPRRVDPVRGAGRTPHREPAAGHDPAHAARGVSYVSDGAAARPLRGGASSPRRRLPRDGLLADRHRRPVLLGRALADRPLLRAARLGRVGRLRRVVRRALARDPLAAAARDRARPLPGRRSRPRHAVGGARRPARGVRASGEGQGRERGAGAREAHAAERADPDRHRGGDPARSAHGGLDHPRVRVRAARPRAVGARRDHRPRPAGRAGRDPVRGVLYRPDQLRGGPRLRAPRPPDPLRLRRRCADGPSGTSRSRSVSRSRSSP